jgi:hypothetical protein
MTAETNKLGMQRFADRDDALNRPCLIVAAGAAS